MSEPVADSPEAAALLGRGVIVKECPADAGLVDRLFPEEREVVAKAVRKRRAEFAAGRLAARSALRELGLPGAPLLPGDDRAPIWPEGIVGSITHAGDLALAAVAPADRYAGIGLDLERDEPIERELWPSILTPAEIDGLDGAEEAMGRQVRLLFTAKEAFFKCFYPGTGVFYGFSDVRISVRSDGRFGAHVIPRDTPPSHDPCGRWTRSRGCVLSGIVAAVEVPDADSR